LLTLTLSLAAGLFSAQQLSSKSMRVSVDGTSSLHDWTMTATAGSFSATANGDVLTNVKFTVPAKNLKSTKGKMMDNKAHAALKADTNPNISFTATSVKVGKSTLSGKLSIAGATKTIAIPVNVVKTGTSYTITGTQSLKMTDYGMQTPGFMGVKTGDQVKVSVNIVTN